MSPLAPIVEPSPLVPPLPIAEGGKQRVSSTKARKQRVSQPAAEPLVIPVQQPDQLVHQKKIRAAAYYKDLSPVELSRLPKDTVNKIGKHFVDISDAPDIVEGIIVGIVRENKTKPLCFCEWFIFSKILV
jgi:hypothetical protein